MFREDSVTTKFFRRYTRVIGLEYLWETLALLLNELQDSVTEMNNKRCTKNLIIIKNLFKNNNLLLLLVGNTTSSESGSSSGTQGISIALTKLAPSTSQQPVVDEGFEVDPSKLDAEADEKINKLNLVL